MPGIFDDVVESLAFGFAVDHRFLDAQVGAHDLEGGDASSSRFGQEALRNDPAQRIRQTNPNQTFFIELKHANETVNGLSCVHRMQGGEHQMPGFRCTQGNFDRFTITHLPHQDHLGGLTQGGTQSICKGIEIGSQFTLVKGGFDGLMHKLHGIFQGHNVYRMCTIDFTKDRGNGGGFPGSRRPAEDHDSVFFLGDLFESRGQLQILNRGNGGR